MGTARKPANGAVRSFWTAADRDGDIAAGAAQYPRALPSKECGEGSGGSARRVWRNGIIRRRVAEDSDSEGIFFG